MAQKSRVLLFSEDPQISADLMKQLWTGPFVVDAASTLTGALLRVRDFAPDLIVASMDGAHGENLCAQAKRIDPLRPVLLLFANNADEAQAQKRTQALGADGFLLRARDEHALLSCANIAIRLRQATRELEELRNKADEQVLVPPPSPHQSARADLEFFKRLARLEVRRSCRYHYPFTLLVMGIDHFAQCMGAQNAPERAQLLGSMLQTVRKAIRDIDICVTHGEQRLLVGLPQTDLAGARNLADRLRRLLEKHDGHQSLTVSVGMVELTGADPSVTFKRMYQQAITCLRRAQTQGGNRAEAQSA